MYNFHIGFTTSHFLLHISSFSLLLSSHHSFHHLMQPILFLNISQRFKIQLPLSFISPFSNNTKTVDKTLLSSILDVFVISHLFIKLRREKQKQDIIMGHHSCCNKQKVKRGLWSPEEDEKLINYITTYGHGCWSSVPKLAGLQRCGKSCRLRWINYLRPDLKRGSFSPQEAALIIELHTILGNRFVHIIIIIIIITFLLS